MLKVNRDPFASKVAVCVNILHPKNPDPSKMANLRTRTPAMQVQTLPLEGPRILRASHFWGASCFFRPAESWQGQSGFGADVGPTFSSNFLGVSVGEGCLMIHVDKCLNPYSGSTIVTLFTWEHQPFKN